MVRCDIRSCYTINMAELFKDFTVPETFSCTTGGEEEAYIRKQREEFFKNVRNHIGLSAIRADMLFKSLASALTRPYDDGMTDDMIYLLRFETVNVTLASVLDERNISNNHNVSFAVYEPRSYVASKIYTYAQELKAPVDRLV